MRLKGYFLSIALMGLGSAAIAQQEPEHWLEFNGEDQYVVIPSHSDFDLGTDDDLTITCWVSMDQLKNGQRFVARRYMNESGEQTTGYEMWGGSSITQYFAANTPKAGGSNVFSDWCNTGYGATYTWMHLAMVISHTDGYVALYRDGQQGNIKYTSDLDTWTVINDHDVVLGATYSEGEVIEQFCLDGKLADVRFWSRALSQEEIYNDMETTVDSETADLIAAYDFAGIEGLTLPDISGNGHDGTLHGFAPVTPGSAILYSVEASGDTNYTGRGNDNEVAVNAEVTITGEGEYTFGSMTLDLTGTTDLSDIEAVKVYMTELGIFDSRNLSRATLLGTFTELSETMQCTLSGTAPVGTAHLWVTFDVADDAAEGNDISIRLTSLGGMPVESEAASREVLLKRVLVMAPGDYGSAYYRIPGIITAQDGSLVAVTDARKYDQGDLPGDIDVTVRRSTDGGATWSEPVIIAKGLGQKRGYGDAALVQTNEEGGLLCIFAGANGLWDSTPYDPIRTYYSKSNDNGVTWSEPVDITDQIYGAGCDDPTRASWRASFCASGRGLLTSDGRIMFVAAIRHSSYNQTLYNHVVYSDDNGATWHVSESAMTGGDESKVVELNDGTILMSIRRQGGGPRYFNTSNDGGETWNTYSEWPELVEQGCNGDIVRYTSTLDGYDKDRILHTIVNDRSTRQNVTMFLSYNEGTTWPVKKSICKTGSAYSSITILEDGTIGVYIEENYNTNDYSTYFLNFSLDWLTDGADQWVEAGTEAVAAPVFSVEGGKYQTAQTVEITCETEGAEIHYTLDGTTPTAQSALYTEPLVINETTTLKAIAMKEGMANSRMTEATYSFFEWEIPGGTTHSTESRYVTSATTTGATADLEYTCSSNPGVVYINTEAGMTVQQGQSFDLNIVSTNDMKWCHAIVFVDWNLDYDFDDEGEELFKVGSDVNDSDVPSDLVANGNQGVPDFTRTINVPANAAVGTTRMRIQFTDAWHIKGVDHPAHSAMDDVDKGRVYDFDVTVTAGVPRLTIAETENGTVTVADSDTGETINDGDEVTVGQFLTITFTPDEGYLFDSVSIDGEDATWLVSDNKLETEVTLETGISVEAVFAAMPKLYIDETENGTITVEYAFAEDLPALEDGDALEPGMMIAITFTPDESYEIKSATVAGQDVTTLLVDGTFAYMVGNEDIHVAAEFDQVEGLDEVSAGNAYYDADSQTLHIDGHRLVKLYDVTGRLVVETEAETTCDISGLGDGIYVALVDGKVIKFRK